MAKLTKKQKAFATDVDRTRDYSVADAAAIVKKGATANFDETIEISMNLGLSLIHI